MHSLRFASLTGPCKGVTLVNACNFLFAFYITFQRENQVLVDHQSAPLKVFHSVNPLNSKSIDFNCVIFNRAEKKVAFVNIIHHLVLSEPHEKFF